jgi:hypothetical protein
MKWSYEMRKRELQIKITENKTGGEIFSYQLMLCKNGYQWWGSEIDNADQMRQIAAALIAKADEIEKVQREAVAYASSLIGNKEED